MITRKIGGFYPLLIFCSLVFPQKLYAQTLNPEQLPPPQDILPNTNPEPADSLKPLPPPEELLPNFPSNSEEIPEPEVPGTITIKRFEFVGSTVFNQEELAAVTEAYTNRPISFAELLQARSAVTQLYIDNGYVTSGAYIPTQELDGEVVTINIVEGSLEEINIKGTAKFLPGYIRSRLALATQTPLNVPRLLEALRLLQLDPLVKNISAELSAGTRPGTSILDVEIQEAKTFGLEAVIDNGRSPSVGSFRQRVTISEANLMGIGDRLSGTYTHTDGSDDFDLSYNIPFNPRNGTINLAYGTSSSEVIEPPFDDIDGHGKSPDIESESRYYEISLRQPIIQTVNQEFALGLTFNHQQSETSLLEIPFPLSPGANEQGETKISALRFFQEWTQRNEREVIAARSEFSLGVDVFDATMNAQSPDSSFFAWRGQAQWVRSLGRDTLLLARTNIQLADRPLLPLEQFALGGLGSVRGYRQDLLLTDNGVFGSLEVRVPILRLGKQEGVLQIIPFFDVGTAWNSGSRTNPDPNTLASVGLGLQWQQGDRFNARLDWGIPLIDVDSGDRTLQEQGLLFSVFYKFF